MSGQTKIPVIFLIDIEPDAHFIGRQRPVSWPGYKKAVEFLEEARPRIQKATGSPAKFSWGFRMDPQIGDTYGRLDWVVSHYAEQFKQLSARRDAMGIHLHPYRWDEKIQGWISDFGNAAWVERCVVDAVRTFRESTGRDCDYFRFGERWMSDAAMNLLRKLDVLCDLSLEPLHGAVASFHPDKPHTGHIPDQRDIPRSPYQPMHVDYRRPAAGKKEGLWEIPLTTARIRPRLKFWLKPFVETANLYLPPHVIGRIVADALSRKGPRYLAMVTRADVFTREEYFKNFKESLAGLLRHPAAKCLVFVSPVEALRTLSLVWQELI